MLQQLRGTGRAAGLEQRRRFGGDVLRPERQLVDGRQVAQVRPEAAGADAEHPHRRIERGEVATQLPDRVGLVDQRVGLDEGQHLAQEHPRRVGHHEHRPAADQVRGQLHEERLRRVGDQ